MIRLLLAVFAIVSLVSAQYPGQTSPGSVAEVYDHAWTGYIMPSGLHQSVYSVNDARFCDVNCGIRPVVIHHRLDLDTGKEITTDIVVNVVTCHYHDDPDISGGSDLTFDWLWGDGFLPGEGELCWFSVRVAFTWWSTIPWTHVVKELHGPLL